MARPKRVAATERRTAAATLRSVPFFAYSCEELPGVRGAGDSPAKALANMRSELRRRYPFNQYDIVETVLDH